MLTLNAATTGGQTGGQGNSMRKRIPSRLHLLSVREIQTAGEGDHSDGDGLILRIRGQSASWVFRYTAATGKRREMGFGIAHRANAGQAGKALTDARELAGDARKLLQRGVDPIDERDRNREADRAAKLEAKAERARDKLTLARAARDYHERVIEPSRTVKHAVQWISSLENHIPHAIWHAPIATIEAPALLAALSAVRSLGDRSQRVPETLMRVRQRLDAVFEDAIFHGNCTSNPAAAIRRKMRETQSKRDRGQFAALPYREAPAFITELRAAEGTAARCLEFAVLTAARTSEALFAEWCEFDFDSALWVIPAAKMKAKEEHSIHLSPGALKVLEFQRGVDSIYVFPSTVKTGKPMSNMAMLAVLDRLGVRDRTTVHGLCRATFSTWANETGAGRPDVIEACLAHEESNRVRAAYNRSKFAEERRALLAAWGEYLGKPASNIVSIRA